MTTDWLGGGLIMAIAAGLWLLYFMPTWSRRREYLATERNAVRLQQTLRILAETAEVPDEIRVETTARSVAAQQRYLRQTELAATPVAVLISARIRRSRAVTTGVLALSLVIALLGGFQLALTGAWIVVTIGAVVGGLCVLMLVRLARAGRDLRLPAPAQPRQAQELIDHAEYFVIDTNQKAKAERTAVPWTPVPLPKPLYVARVVTPGLAATSPAVAREVSLEIEADLKRAAADAENALRAAASAAAAGPAAEPIPLTQPEPLAAPSRFSAMGIVDADAAQPIDLDEVLARRRAG